ncbi:MAG: hypothetical protein LBT47_05150 [Deltaproteobacteria bacterium]|nr:hypothetical protein [Deltaproteobacteria bacterium]
MRSVRTNHVLLPGPLSSTASSQVWLFGCFYGTMRSSDFSKSYALDLSFWFPLPSVRVTSLGDLELSLSRQLNFHHDRFSDAAGSLNSFALPLPRMLPSAHCYNVGTPIDYFSAQLAALIFHY